MKRLLLLGLFVVLMADSMFGWGLGLGPGLSIKNAVLYLIVLVLALEYAVARERTIFELPSIHVLFGLLIAIACFSWAANTFVGSYADYNPLRGFFALKGRLIDYYLFFLVFFLGARSQSDAIWLQRWILVVIALGSIATVMDAYNLPDLNVIELRRDGRVQGPLGEANQYGLFVAMFLPILIAKAWTGKGLERAFFGIGALFTFWVMVLTVSRGAYFALLAGSLIAVIYLRPYLNIRYVRRFAVAGLVVFVVTALVLGQDYANLITERTLEAASGGDAYEMTSGRTWIWVSALERMLTHPLSLITGYGWNTFRQVMQIAPHNTYFGYFFELGIIGTFIFVMLVTGILRRTKAALAVGNTDRFVYLGLIGFVFGFCVLLTGLLFLDLTTPWYFVWAYCGIAMRAVTEALGQSGTTEESRVSTSREAPAWPRVPVRRGRI